jgi:predicted DNA-binding protein (MmcQ/YjbR family)
MTPKNSKVDRRDELVLGLLEDSYELVVEGLPKRERELA